MAYYKMTKTVILCPSTKEIHAWLDAGNDPNDPHPKYGLLLKSVIQDHKLRRVTQDRLPNARLLLERGADPNKRLPTGATVFQYACSCALSACVSLLLEFGAKVESQCLFDTMKRNFDERAAETLDILISAGADIEAAYFSDNSEAAYFSDNSEAAYFSDNSEEYWDPLPFACMLGMDACVRVLLRAGADPNRLLWDGSTCLHMAADKENPTTIEMLLDAGAQIDAQDKKGNSPLLYACKWYGEGDSEDTIQTLLAGGASLTVRNNKGKQARDYASTREMIELLTRQPKGAL